MSNIRDRRFLVAIVAVGALGLMGCENAGSNRVLSIESEGVVAGLAYFDANGSNAFEGASDAPLSSVGVQLLAKGSREVVAEHTTSADGLFLFSEVPVGSYAIGVDATTLDDSLTLGGVDVTSIALSPDDSATANVAITFPTVSASVARSLAAGTKVFVHAVALNGRETFGDNTVHIWDGTAFIRLTGVQNAVAQGDSARFLGSRATGNGQPTLSGVRVFGIGGGVVPQPSQTSSSVAALADGGRLDAALVLVNGAVITDTTTALGGDYVATVDDGTGPLNVVFDQDLTFPLMRSRFRPGAVLNVTGLLISSATSGPWNLKPRANADVIVN